MSSCKDCLHNEACNIFAGDLNEDGAEKCRCFKKRNRFVELPCKIGDEVYITKDEEICKFRFASAAVALVNEKNDMFIAIPEDFGEECFLSKEEAEQALKENKNE